MAREPRATGGARRRCSDPTGKGCKGFARRNTVPATCHACGGGTRAATRHSLDEDTGAPITTQRGMVSVPPRTQALLNGTLSVEDLDEEELARGYPRSADGSFRGAPVVVPRVLHQRMTRELFERANRHLKTNLLKVVESMTRIAMDPAVEPATRLKAATFVIERTMGKVPDVNVTVDEKRYEAVLERMNRDAIVVEVVDDGRTP